MVRPYRQGAAAGLTRRSPGFLACSSVAKHLHLPADPADAQDLVHSAVGADGYPAIVHWVVLRVTCRHRLRLPSYWRGRAAHQHPAIVHWVKHILTLLRARNR